MFNIRFRLSLAGKPRKPIISILKNLCLVCFLSYIMRANYFKTSSGISKKKKKVEIFLVENKINGLNVQIPANSITTFWLRLLSRWPHYT